MPAIIQLTQKGNRTCYYVERRRLNFLGFFDYSYDFTGNKEEATVFNTEEDCQEAWQRALRLIDLDRYAEGIRRVLPNCQVSFNAVV